MNKWIKALWIATVVLLLFYAFDSLVLDLVRPVVFPTLDTFFDRVAGAFVSIVLAAGIIVYLKHKHD
jgi:hypothetical protein